MTDPLIIAWNAMPISHRIELTLLKITLDAGWRSAGLTPVRYEA